MPLYDYRCHKCGETFEVKQKFSDEPLTVHEGCGGELERLISAPALQFKGSGWYITDYARKSHSSGKSDSSTPSSPSKSASETGKSDSTKSESKPAAKTGE
jgi:putative FmdB family regulatory protein